MEQLSHLFYCLLFCIFFCNAHSSGDDDSENDELEATNVILFLFFGLGLGILVTQVLSHLEDTVPYTVVIFVLGVIFSATDGHKSMFSANY